MDSEKPQGTEDEFFEALDVLSATGAKSEYINRVTDAVAEFYGQVSLEQMKAK